ncbi:MAG TPA: CDP-alcohol phosphatidyltransferase family protein [Chloroflexia bacterium]|nr:CDP-alcohol phosphatidyltransferase family protein [Chloroflexia bacterium]
MIHQPTAISRWEQAGAFTVHIYTAAGVVLAFLMVLAAISGNTVSALWLGGAAVIIDGTDGALARRLRVQERIPWFDGSLLDNIVDYLTYVFAPVILLWSAGYLPSGLPGMTVAVLPLLASSFQFCRVDAKTDDHFFLGFPSYWNVVAFYAIVNHLDVTVLSLIIVGCSLLVFVPIKYVYPTRTVTARPITLGLVGLWGLVCGTILLQMPHPNPLLINLSYLFLVYYFVLSLYLTLSHRPDIAPPRR